MIQHRHLEAIRHVPLPFQAPEELLDHAPGGDRDDHGLHGSRFSFAGGWKDGCGRQHVHGPDRLGHRDGGQLLQLQLHHRPGLLGRARRKVGHAHKDVFRRKPCHVELVAPKRTPALADHQRGQRIGRSNVFFPSEGERSRVELPQPPRVRADLEHIAGMPACHIRWNRMRNENPGAPPGQTRLPHCALRVESGCP